MKYFVGHIFVNGIIKFEYLGVRGHNPEIGITINFPFHGHVPKKKATKLLIQTLQQNKINWLQFERPHWKFCSVKFKSQFSEDYKEEWLDGKLIIDMEHDIVSKNGQEMTYLKFVITKEEVMNQWPNKIFLSHNSTDKGLVRKYKKALEMFGYSTWLDDDMHAGAEPTNNISDGFQRSCAAVFFITPNFKETSFITMEIDCALKEKSCKNEKFSIISLLLGNAKDTFTILTKLDDFVYKQPKSDLEGFCNIIEALPMQNPNPIWK